MLLQNYLYLKDVSTQSEEINNTDDDIIKIVFINSGKGNILINDCVYNVNTDDMYIIDSHSPHYFSIKSGEPFVVSMLKLERSTLLKTMQNLEQSFDAFCDKPYVLDNIGSNKIKDIFSRISLFTEPADILVIEKLLTLMRICTENSRNAQSKSTAVNRILKYINDNLCKRLDLDIISENLHSSVWYMCHTFKESTGFTVKEYIRLVRIRKAEILLTTTDYSISAISEMCGFENFSFFSRVFSKEKGLTPSAYRKNNVAANVVISTKRNSATAISIADNQYRVYSTNPIIPAYEYTTIDLTRIYLELFGANAYSGENLTWVSEEANLIFDNQKHLLSVGEVGTYRAKICYKDITREIAICVIPHNADTKQTTHEVTLFEYDFNNKTTDEILKDWILQTRSNNASSFNPPEYPNEPLKKSKKGFVPFPCAYKDKSGTIRDVYFNYPKDPTNVGFMYLRDGSIPEMFSDYRIYFSGTLNNLAKNVPTSKYGSTAAKVGLIGRIKTNSEHLLDCTSQYQASLVSVADHPFYKLRGQNAHQNIFLTENLFFEFGYDSETPKYFATDISNINIGDSYSVMMEFNSTTISTGIKKGSIDDKSKYSQREIHSECSQLTNGVNYLRTNKIHSFSTEQANLCTSVKGTVGFAYMGVETAIQKFKVTHIVNTSNIPTVAYISPQKITELINKRQRSVLPTPKSSSTIPVRHQQKALNVRTKRDTDIKRPENRLSKFCILSNLHLSHKNYFTDFENMALYKKNFLNYINASDTEFLISCGDNLENGHDYSYEHSIMSFKNLSAFYNLLNYMPNKDYFVLKGNRDDAISDFADRFIIIEDNITIIGFRAKYIQYEKTQNRYYLSAGVMEQDTLNWLIKACEEAVKKNPDTHIIFTCHFSVIDSLNSTGFAEDGFALLADSKKESAYRNELLDILTAYGVELFISGHEDNNDMHYNPIYYRTGYNTGCINYITGNTPVDCTLSQNNGQTYVTLEQYFYGDFIDSKSRPKKSLTKTLQFPLNHRGDENRLERAQQFLVAKQKLTDTFSERFNGLYKYSFAYCGEEEIDGKLYYKFDVSVLKYYISNNTTVYADSDEEIDSLNLTAHLLDAYIPTDASFIGKLTKDGIKPIQKD